jgi:hypothetical protein
MSIITDTLPDGLVQKAYSSTTLKTDGGKAPLVWSIASGALPTGMKISSSGTISGTPTVTGTFAFTVRVADASTPKNTATKTFTITIAPMTITTTSLPTGKAGYYYNQTLKVSGGKAGYTWIVTSGALPRGIRLATGGTLSGIPTAAGSYTFTVRVTDKGVPVNTDSKTFTLTVNPAVGAAVRAE